MSILRDERLVALFDLVEACRSSASHAALAAEIMTGDPRAGDLQALADRRNNDADFFAERMIAEGDIPGGPPEERSLVGTALAQLRATLDDKGEEALLDDCRAQEEALRQQAEAARQAPLRDDEKAAAARLADDKAAVLARA